MLLASYVHSPFSGRQGMRGARSGAEAVGPRCESTAYQGLEEGDPGRGCKGFLASLVLVSSCSARWSLLGKLTDKLPVLHGRGAAVPVSGQWRPAQHSTQATASLAPGLWREVPLEEVQGAERKAPTAFLKPGGLHYPNLTWQQAPGS